MRALTVLTLALCAVSLLGFAGGWHWTLDLASHFRTHYAALLLLALLIGVWCGVRGLVLVLAAACLATQLGALVPFYLQPNLPAFAVSAPLKVLLANVYTGNRSFDAVGALIQSEDPDVVVLQETDQAWLDGLADVRRTYPNRIEEPRADNFGLAVWTRVKTANARIVRMGRAGVPSVIADLERDGQTLVLIATHPLPPAGGDRSALRNESLHQLARFAASEASPVLVVGDLNCTAWSPHFRALLRDGHLHDSALGHGVQPTWPSSFLWFGIPIDHALHGDGLRVLRRRVGKDIGSDHRPLLVDVAWVQTK